MWEDGGFALQNNPWERGWRRYASASVLQHDAFLSIRKHALALGIAAAVAWVAYDGGSYSIASRSTIGIAVWFALAAAFALWARGGMRSAERAG